MRSRSLAAQRDDVVSRRLELLTSELAEVRGVPRIHAVPALDDLDDLPAEADGAGPVRGTGPAPTVARLPGRHASRRQLLPEGLRGRLSFGPGQVAVVAVLVAVGLAVTCWLLVRGAGRATPVPTVLQTPAAALTSLAPASTPPTRIVVDVTGKVRRPGIAVLRAGARVVDAVRAAGGARPGVDLGSLNLAQVLTDGQLVVVGDRLPAPPGGAAAPSTAAGAAPVDINTADETTLESLPEVGPVTAAAIIAWRGQHGGFTSVDQLLDVDGIGAATLAKLAPLVTI